LELSASQLAFVDHVAGPAILQAAVGTGKTLCLAERASRAIKRGIDPQRLPCLTFTNRAAEELRQRLVKQCGSIGAQVMASTFHSLCAWMLRVEAKHIGIPANFIIYDEVDSVELLRQIMSGPNGSGSGNRSPASDRSTPLDLYHRLQKLKAETPESMIDLDFNRLCRYLSENCGEIAAAYQQKLSQLYALDFADLVYLTRSMLKKLPEVAERWEKRFDFIQVDEMQDTHLSEYSVLRTLACRCRNVVLAGDYDQTIYEWRGSTPSQILSRFSADFPNPKIFTLDINYRSTKVLLAAASAVAASYSRYQPPRPAASARQGRPIVAHCAANEDAEGRWIGRQIKQLCREHPSLSLNRVAVLVRSNSRALTIAEGLKYHNIPHITVEAYEFFRRQEIKDALAYLRFLINPGEERSLQRILLRPSRGIGERTINRIQEAAHSGLRMVDMVDPLLLEQGEPYARLLKEYHDGVVTVFDTETTGVNPGRDEIVELAAIRLEGGRPKERFHAFLKNSVKVGPSAHIHGLDDAFLARHGRPPAHVLQEFYRFAQGSILVGHNVHFDIRMLAAYSKRLGLYAPASAPAPVPAPAPAVALPLQAYDTLDIARRFVDTDRYTLAALCQYFGIAEKPTHRAPDDVEATCALLHHLVPLVRAGAYTRRRLVEVLAKSFTPLALEIAGLRAKAAVLRPPLLLKKVLTESGLAAYYAGEAHRQENLNRLIHIFTVRDQSTCDPLSSLESLVHFASLARNVDYIDPEEQKVCVLTVHQSKGLEFDIVFVAGLCDGEFPNYFSVREGRETEEKRLFYVAVTRARERLFLSGHGYNDEYQRRRQPSPYFGLLGSYWVEEDSTLLEQIFRYRTAR